MPVSVCPLTVFGFAGGNTEFADMRAANDALDPETW
jgi:hypothetical protein